MDRPFLTNIEEANSQLKAVDAELVTAKASVSTLTDENAKLKSDLEAANLKASNATTTATTAAESVGRLTAENAKLKSDLEAAKNASVTAGAAAGVPPVNGATPTPAADLKKSTEGKTGNARAAAAFASMQPK